METQLAQNNVLLNKLGESGDIANRPRKITHWIFGVDQSKSKLLVAQLKHRGYIIHMIEADKIAFYRVGTAALAEFDNETRAINGLCRELGCLYDGWETELVRE